MTKPITGYQYVPTGRNNRVARQKGIEAHKKGMCFTDDNPYISDGAGGYAAWWSAGWMYSERLEE